MLLNFANANANKKTNKKNISKVFEKYLKKFLKCKCKYFSFEKFKCKCKYFSKVFKMHLNANAAAIWDCGLVV